MPSSYTSLLKFAKPGLGDTGWGTTVNGGFTDMVEQALTGYVQKAVTVAGPNTIPTIADGASSDGRNQFIELTGTLASPATLTVPAGTLVGSAGNNKLYFIKNSAGDAVTITTGGANTFVVPNGKSMMLRVTNTGVEVVADQFVNLDASGNVSFDGGTFVFNESGADKDARFEGDTDANLLFLDASTDRVGIGTSLPAAKLDVNGPASVTSFTGSTRLGVTVKGSTAATDYSGIDFSGNNQTVPTARIAVLSPAAGSSLVFGTSNNYAAGVTNSALVITPSGDLGIGTTSPQQRLVVSNGGAAGLEIGPTAVNSAPAIVSYDRSGAVWIQLTYGAGEHVWQVSGAERMRLTTSGEFYVGTNNGSYFTSEGARVFPTGSASSSFVAFTNNGNGGTNLALVNSNGSTTSWNAVVFQFNTTSVGSITCTPTTTSYNQSSDRRLKTAVAPAADAGALLDAVQVVEVDWKVGGHVRYGVIAQDLHLIAPEVVTPGDNNEEVERPWGVDYSKLVPMLIKEVQSLRARVAALEAK